MAILNNSNAISSGGYDINNSLRFRSSASAFLNRTPGTTGNQKTFTWSGWVKRGALGSQQMIHHAFYGDSGRYATIYFTSSDTLAVASGIYTTGASTTTSYNYITTQVFRDPSAWYHIVLAVDTTQATSGNRVKVYVNGSQITAFGTSTAPSQNDNTFFNITTSPMYIGKYAEAPGSSFLDGYLAEVNWIDGTALTPSSFGETDTTTGSWKPKAYTSTYGTNGFYLKFSDIATTSGSNAGLGKDFSGNANYWTTNNISVTAGTTYDAMTDSPTLTSATVANYATLNPLIPSTLTYSEANLTVQRTTSNWEATGSTISVSQGKWYAEFVWTAGTYAIIGVEDMDLVSTWDNEYIGYSANGRGYGWDGNVRNNASDSAYGSTFTTGDIIGVAIDMDNKFVYMSKNGVFQNSGVPTSGATGTGGLSLAGTNYIIGAAAYSATISANFGQRPFSYTPPTGFVRLNTYNLPDSTIKKGSQYFNTVLYTGNGSTNAITGVGFSPDFVWVKNRAVAEHNCLYDSVRGVYKQLYSNLTNAEDNATNSLTSFDSDGFTLGNNTTPNANGNAHVSWNWRGLDSSAVSNTSGSITSTVSVNTTAGFSIVTYTGLVGDNTNRTIGHGLGVAPAMVIIKNRNWAAADNAWMVWHKSDAAKTLILNKTDASSSGDFTYYLGGTAPTNTVFTTRADTTVSTGNRYATQGRADGYVAYCWAEIAGFSKFGSYTGNGSADGPFVFTNFRPKFILVKRTDSSTNGFWNVYDSSRNGYNDDNDVLYPNSSAAEDSVQHIDLLSNGFKCRNATYPNTSTGTYIYAAFAENPFKNANAR